jgi:hypothetical protein
MMREAARTIGFTELLVRVMDVRIVQFDRST